MEANPVRIVQYFDGEKQSITPLFQRPYTWNKRNWQSLWDDILSYYNREHDSASSHFMGAVVSIPAKTVPVGVTKHLVIDGQQRLTTVAIMLCALRDSCDERKSHQIQDYLVNRHYDNSVDHLKLLPTQGDRTAYLSIVNPRPQDHISKHLIIDCYEFFKKAISEKDENEQQIDPGKILDIVKSLLQVVMINLGEADDPYLIFESLNFKGEPLSQGDLVRNYILMRFRGSVGEGGEQERIYREIWHPMESRLGEGFEDFLWHYTIKDGDNVKKPKVYSSIKHNFSQIKEPIDVECHIGEMNKASINYERFLNPGKESNTKIQKELALLFRLEATISYPLLLKLFSACDNNQFDEDILVNCLRNINSLMVRRAVCEEKRSALNKLFIGIASRMPREIADMDEWIANELAKRVRSERWPDDIEFRSAILTNNLYGTKAARIVLDGIEAHLAGKEVIDLSSDKISIEHIMPQTLNDDWLREIGGSDEIHRKYLDTLGNLTLTGINSELGNMKFSEKKQMYAGSGVSMNRDLSTYESWSESEILKRSSMLADYAVKIWPRYSA
ncbi:DUF262 domain-containing protein [Ampullimonas aquatilis]|uniref:DUF262 domain-containing protein n=1 Tax=Ampullimonas aquatilis TaxID=1341549 RepID=UPI003C70853E